MRFRGVRCFLGDPSLFSSDIFECDLGIPYLGLGLGIRSRVRVRVRAMVKVR